VFSVPTTADLARRIPRLLAGLTLCGVGLGAMVLARLGLGPWEVLHQGLARHTGMRIGTISILVGALVLLGWLPLRQRLGVGTICNTVIIGLVMNVVIGGGAEPSGLVARVTYMAGGVVLVGIGSGLYIGAGLGPGPRDGLMTGIAARGRSVRLVRTGLELAALVAGWLMGGDVGIGTVVFAVGIGPLLQLFLGYLTVPTLTAPAE
jgi:uncharacterized membrane protein YczE